MLIKPLLEKPTSNEDRNCNASSDGKGWLDPKSALEDFEEHQQSNSGPEGNKAKLTDVAERVLDAQVGDDTSKVRS